MSDQSTGILGDEHMDVQEIPDSKQRSESKIVQRSSVRFSPETWERDRTERFQIEPLVQLFHRSVPALRFLNWRIEEIERGYAVTRLPLNVESSNQYITQQAALMLLAADYTGGIALSTLFNAPVIGFHPQKTHYGAYLWGAAATIKWLRPSTDDLILESTIPECDWDAIAETFESGDEVNYKARIKMFSGGRIAAVSDFQYWGRNSRSLAATGATLASTHHMLAHKLKTSARLIAGLRAGLETNAGEFDPFAAKAAGVQGRAMARKFSADTPELADMILARTVHCDAALKRFAKANNRFTVVNIGSGYDSRPWRLRGLGEVTFVQIDLPAMSDDAARVLPSVEQSEYRVIRSAFDLTTGTLKSTLSAANCGSPFFFIWEGGSMYFGEQEAQQLFDQISALMCNQSRLWFDQVSSAAVSDKTGIPEIKVFMDSMRMIGEPFIRGFAYVDEEVRLAGFDIDEVKTASQVLARDELIFEHYSFAVCKRLNPFC